MLFTQKLNFVKIKKAMEDVCYMEWGNAILLWAIGAFVLLILNFTVLRFGFIRKALYIISTILLIAVGFSFNSEVAKVMTNMGGKIEWNIGNNVPSLATFSTIDLIFVILLSFGDSLSDFEDTTDYNVDVTSFLGVYFFKCSEEVVSVPSFFSYYLISTVAGLVVYIVGVCWLHWFAIYGIIGIIILAYIFVIKPILLKLF